MNTNTIKTVVITAVVSIVLTLALVYAFSPKAVNNNSHSVTYKMMTDF